MALNDLRTQIQSYTESRYGGHAFIFNAEIPGYEVVAVADSTQVLRVIEVERPKLLLIDLWMPGLSGDQVVSSLRRNETLKGLPVIVILASHDGKAIAYASGADDFIEKPYDSQTLIELVKRRIDIYSI